MTFIKLDAKKTITYAIQYSMELIPTVQCVRCDESFDTDDIENKYVFCPHCNKKTHNANHSVTNKRSFHSFVSPTHFKSPKMSALNYNWTWYHLLNAGPYELDPIPIIFPTTFRNRILFEHDQFNKLDLETHSPEANNPEFTDFSSAILLFEEKEIARQFLAHRIFDGTYLKRILHPFKGELYTEASISRDENKNWERTLKKDTIVSDTQTIVAQTGYCEAIGWLPRHFYEDLTPQLIMTDIVGSQAISESDFNTEPNYPQEEYLFVSGTFFETYTIKGLPLNPTLLQERWIF